MFIKQLSIFSLLLIANIVTLNAMNQNYPSKLGSIKILNLKEIDEYTPKHAEPVLAVFNQQPAFTYEQKLAIKQWHKAHKEFRKQWSILRQTIEYSNYYETKKKRTEAKATKNATKEGQLYLAAKKEANELLTKVPTINVKTDIFIIVPTRNDGYKLVLKNRIKYTQ